MTRIITQQCYNSCVAAPFSEKLRQNDSTAQQLIFYLLFNNKFPIYILLSHKSPFSSHELMIQRTSWTNRLTKNLTRELILAATPIFKDGKLRAVSPEIAMVTSVVLSKGGAHLLHIAWLHGNTAPLEIGKKRTSP